MTQEQKKQLLEHIETVRRIRDGFFSDSDIEDFCDEHKIPYRDAYDFIDKNRVPPCCKGCKHVGMFDNCYPCDVCSRPRKDMYEAE